VGGRARQIASAFFGFQFMVESHHILKTIIHGEYFTGAVTATVIVGLGAMIVTSVWREFRGNRHNAANILA